VSRGVFLDLNGTLVEPLRPEPLHELTLIAGVAEAVARLTAAGLSAQWSRCRAGLEKDYFRGATSRRGSRASRPTSRRMAPMLLGRMSVPIVSPSPAHARNRILLYERRFVMCNAVGAINRESLVAWRLHPSNLGRRTPDVSRLPSEVHETFREPFAGRSKVSLGPFSYRHPANRVARVRYVCLSVAIGSIRAVRQAGPAAAMIEAAPTIIATPTNVRGSNVSTPKR